MRFLPLRLGLSELVKAVGRDGAAERVGERSPVRKEVEGRLSDRAFPAPSRHGQLRPSAPWVTRGQRCRGSRRAQVGQARGEGQPASRKGAASWSAGLCRRLVVEHGAFTRRNSGIHFPRAGEPRRLSIRRPRAAPKTYIPHAGTARPGRGLLAPERHGHVSCERVGKQTFATRGAPGGGGQGARRGRSWPDHRNDMDSNPTRRPRLPPTMPV